MDNNMDFMSKFVAIELKYDFIDNFKSNVSENWVNGRLNVRPLDEFGRCMQVICYPKNYKELTPYFTIDIDIMDVKFGPVVSRTKMNVYGLFWNHGEKRCKLFFAFDNAEIYNTYTVYLKKLLKYLEKIQIDHDVPYINVKPFSLNLSWNDGLVETLNDTQSIMSDNGLVEKPICDSMRVSDASGTYHEVILRDSTEKNHRQSLRPIAVISDMFARHKSFIPSNKAPPLPSRLSNQEKNEKNGKKLRKKKSFWDKLTTSKRNENYSNGQPSIDEQQKLWSSSEHFHSSFDIDFDWCEINEDDIPLPDMRPSDIFDRMNMHDDNLCSTIESKINGQHLNISSNILWSHNLSLSRLSNGDVSNVNLLGANLNKDQIHSDVYIEEDQQQLLGARKRLNFARASIASIDSGGYAVMRPILSQESNDILDQNYEFMSFEGINKLSDSFDDGSSSGFSSDEDSASSQQSFDAQVLLRKNSMKDEAISMSFNESISNTPSSRTSSTQLLFNAPPYKSNYFIRNRLENHLLTPKSHKSSTNVDDIVSLLNNSSDSSKEIRNGTPYKLHDLGQFTYFGDKTSTSRSPIVNFKNFVKNRTPFRELSKKFASKSTGNNNKLTVNISDMKRLTKSQDNFNDTAISSEKLLHSQSIQKRFIDKCTKIRKRSINILPLSPRTILV